MKKGFTLLELIIVIIILGVLASLAVPQYINAVERGRLGEALSLLGLIRSSQMRYYAQFGNFTADMTKIDADYTTPKFFTVDSPAGSDAEVAKVTRSGEVKPLGDYTMTISKDGCITCSGTNCVKLGY
jgi:prepilin-type N-terminal cleavage/methylation domain-containing protein